MREATVVTYFRTLISVEFCEFAYFISKKRSLEMREVVEKITLRGVSSLRTAY
jgi:hypothetical protein